MRDMNRIVGSHDIVLVTLDTLRYDVAQAAWQDGRTPNLARLLPGDGWEARHSPGSFTYAAHQAFFGGFLPTPTRPGPHPRPFACRFEGSETAIAESCVLDAPDIVSGLAARGYHTICIGGVGFFNPSSPLGRVLPGLFAESYWSPELGVTDPRSTEHQLGLAARRLSELAADLPVFLFVNISALHQPNCCYLDGATEDTLESHAAALAYVDSQLPVLTNGLRARSRPAFCVLTSDHGTAYGEDGYAGHRLAHPVVWTVPYAELVVGEDD